MLRAKVIPEILSHAVTGGISTAFLMTTEGALLGTVGGIENLDNKLLGAIVTNAWNDYDHAGRLLFPSDPIHFQALELKNGGWLGISPAGKGYLVCVYATEASIGYLKKKVLALGEYFENLLQETNGSA